MPEYPDIELYLHAIGTKAQGQRLEKLTLHSPFVLRSFDPPASAIAGRDLVGLRRIGKRIAMDFADGLFCVVHLMIAGRFQWKDGQLPPGKRPIGKIALATWQFETGALILTEASSKKRASIHMVRGETELAAHDPGGKEVFALAAADFQALLRKENRTLKRFLTDPRTLSGIGNAYSDEILHHARLSPILLTGKVGDDEAERLLASCQTVLAEARERLIAQFGTKFPGAGDVTAFRPEFAVHGKFGQPCPVCGRPVQRIAYADNETNYCAGCQTGGRILADRALSRLLKGDFPRSFDDEE